MRIAKRPLLLALTGLAGLSLVVGAVVTLSAGQAHASSAPSSSAVKGTITAVGTVDPMHMPAAAATINHPSAKVPTKGARSLRPGSSASVSAQARQEANRPSGGDTALDDQHPGALLHNFNGVSSLDSAVTNFGAEFEPPDQGLCAGNGFVVEPVNSAFTIYRDNGSVVAGPFNVNVLFDEGLTEFTSDPRCQYDTATHTWYAIILFISTVGGQGVQFTNHAHTDLAVNTSGDPTTPWTVYQIDTTDDGTNGTPSHPGCPCLGDQPRLGIDAHNIYISTDEFSILGPEQNSTQIYAVSKSDLVRHASTIHFVHFDNLFDNGFIAFGVQPAITVGPADAEYFMSSLDPTFTTGNQLGVWALTDGDAVARGDIPTLSHIDINSETFGVPPNAPQKGNANLLNTGDDRMQQVEFVNGQLWGALDTVLTVPGDTTPLAGAAWFRVHPHLNGSVIGGAEVRAQGYVASKSNFLLYPAIAVTRGGTAAIVMTLSGATFFPSAVYTVLRSGQQQFGSIHIAAPGTGAYDPNAGRWGDYSWAVLDPSGDGFWLATEYIPPLASQTTDGVRNWGTRVFEVSSGEGE